MFNHKSDDILEACGVTQQEVLSILTPYILGGARSLNDIHRTLRYQLLDGETIPYKSLLILALILPIVKREGNMYDYIKAYMSTGKYASLSELCEAFDEIDITELLLKSGGYNVRRASDKIN